MDSNILFNKCISWKLQLFLQREIKQIHMFVSVIVRKKPSTLLLNLAEWGVCRISSQDLGYTVSRHIPPFTMEPMHSVLTPIETLESLVRVNGACGSSKFMYRLHAVMSYSKLAPKAGVCCFLQLHPHTNMEQVWLNQLALGKGQLYTPWALMHSNCYACNILHTSWNIFWQDM